jgi:hypothetical protein
LSTRQQFTFNFFFTHSLFLQINDVDLNKQQQISNNNFNNNNVTRLKTTNNKNRIIDEGNLQPLHQPSDKIIKPQSQQSLSQSSPNKVLSHKKAVLFTKWSSWSECDKRCKQKRTRKCANRRKCGSVKQTEERDCEEHL